MIQTLKNAWKIPELRKKILFVLGCMVVFRFGYSIFVPFVDLDMLKTVFDAYSGTVLGFMNVLVGGGFSQASIFALSIYPYINASIIMQLLQVAIPALERMVKEGGEEGRKKLASITRYVTIGLSVIMGYTYYVLLKSSGALTRTDAWSMIVIVLTFAAGSAFVMWLGEQMTEKGIGNGTSLIIFTGIVSSLPQTAISMVSGIIGGSMNIIAAIVLVLVAVALIALTVFVTNAERRIPVQYAKRVIGRKIYGGQSTNIPMKVNMSGVMPVIFASSIVTLPATIIAFLQPAEGSFWYNFQQSFTQGSIPYMIVYALLIVGFAYFYSTIQFNPIEVSNNLRKNGGFIPGFRPGRPTSDFITRVLNKITLMGAIFLGFIALLPQVLSNINGLGGLAVGGTSVLILVGVAIETVKAIEAQMLMRHYKGFLE
ncbi:MAG: preprotein translocase subunit SecY [Clostridia bacterium]|nr:preprotein translocase subunit SecY [Clostridia bacterium]MBQ7087499.1 preprotein translocase subunit SecY [Clostridia bacterium]